MVNWIYNKAKSVSETARAVADLHQSRLTKPPGALGRIEKLAIQLAGLQDCVSPLITHPVITVFAADHGVVEEGVSAFPQEVTVQMILNFTRGGAAVNVLARELNADFEIINMGTVNTVPESAHLRQFIIGKGTKNFCEEAAMSQAQLDMALLAGKNIVEQKANEKMDLFIGGEMGIGNTTSAAALSCAQLGKEARELVGNGTGIDAAGLLRKTAAVDRALQLHHQFVHEPVECLRRLGGFEIAALSGSYIRCSQLGIPVLVDGFICGAAALIAININDTVKPWLIFSHQSAERGHQILLESMQVEPVLKLDMRLGEGSGAAMALPLMKLACALHNNMATFEQAGVSSS